MARQPVCVSDNDGERTQDGSAGGVPLLKAIEWPSENDFLRLQVKVVHWLHVWESRP
jgi:hypothetical protein